MKICEYKITDEFRSLRATDVQCTRFFKARAP